MQFPVLNYFFHETHKSFKQLFYSIRMDGDYKCQPQKRPFDLFHYILSLLKILFDGKKKKKPLKKQKTKTFFPNSILLNFWNFYEIGGALLSELFL